MKFIKKTFCSICAFAFMSVLLISCEKTDLPEAVIANAEDDVATLTNAEAIYIENVRHSIFAIKNGDISSRSSNPEVALGNWLVEGISYANIQESNSLSFSTNKLEYAAHYDNYIVANPMPSNLLTELSQGVQKELFKIGIDIVNVSNEADVNAQLVGLENEIMNNEILTLEAEKSLLIAVGALRIVDGYINTNGFILNGVDMPSYYPETWDECYSFQLGQNLQVLVSFDDTPGTSAFAWWGLPGTLIGSIVNAAYTASTSGC